MKNQVCPGFKTFTQLYLRPYCQACKKEAFICSLIFFCSYSTYLFPCPNWVKTSFMYTYTQYLTSICFSKNQDVHTKESLAKVSKVNWFELICTELGNFIIHSTSIFVLLQVFVILIKGYYFSVWLRLVNSCTFLSLLLT